EDAVGSNLDVGRAADVAVSECVRARGESQHTVANRGETGVAAGAGENDSAGAGLHKVQFASGADFGESAVKRAAGIIEADDVGRGAIVGGRGALDKSVRATPERADEGGQI